MHSHQAADIVRAMTNPLEFPDAPGWRFTVEEVSNSVYRVDGEHIDGRSVSRLGTFDPDMLIKQALSDALSLPP
jgi:hypothetical protein